MLTFKLQGINDAGKATTFVAGTVAVKEFKTGSDGFYANTKTAVPTTAKTIIFELRDDDDVMAVMTVPAKEFKTGSVGYFTSEKCALDGGMYQLQVQLVLVGSKTPVADGVHAALETGKKVDTKNLPNNYQTSVQLVRIGSKPVVAAVQTVDAASEGVAA